ncbi:actin-like protein 6B [Tribolium castaneum]|uniref:Actin-87E-like Protein n=1 Tax=Tribolium castaneum TaxID=7070 RepID=D6W6J4_TRICA|nr:PREDICTED: actin-like protein 6B [Tribolium castaneum]EFA10847.1 Actin-87E-like Protein [Tribolium castaneum]|eukprot:XP_008200235.1 PREDICTED: actin-like protein 6B [Tribolium castaneum]
MSGAVYGGDEVGALVFDIGHNSTRAGFGGEDSPKLDIPSTVGVWLDSHDEISQKRYNIGITSINVRRSEMELTTFLKDGMVENWEIFENFLDYIYSNALRAIPNDHPLLITEPPWVTAPKREQLTELMFEKYNVPALYLAKNASLAAFANGRPTCLVVDSGATHTSAVPVHDGFVLTQAVVKSPAGGDYLSTQCRNYLTEKGIEIVPPCMVASKEVTKAEEAPNFKRRLFHAKLTDSWHNYMIKQVMQDFQASVLQVSDNLYDEEVVKTMPAIHYEFPNGFHKDFGVERFKIPEPLFNPIAGIKSGIQPTLGVGPLVTTSVGMCDIDIRPAMYGSVVVTGGNSNLQGFTERLNRDLAAKTPPSMRLKIISAPGATERKFGAWSGGSILTSLGSFQQLWVSKQEYDDGGKAIVQSKCL